MKFSISRENFLQPLQLVSGAVERRHTLPILSNVLIKVSDNSLWLTGTDLEVELISNVTLSGEFVEGEITVPAKKLLDICRGLNDGSTIDFSVESNKALLKSGRSKYSLSTLSADDYPNLEDWQGELEFEIPQSDLKRLIDSTHLLFQDNTASQAHSLTSLSSVYIYAEPTRWQLRPALSAH